ncbi:MAG TPA: hypothetical protein VF665_06420, partial [Longimicrobium sp.]|uniref:hypothetical protein n=1 Tax=Longimicrobium sp. TaxID=2029185 RepID=UPI002EDB780A
SCAPPSESDLLTMSTPKADKYAREVVAFVRARNAAALAHRFSPGLMQLPGAADTIAGFARFFPPGSTVQQVRLVGAASHWTTQITVRRLTYEVRSTDSAYTLVEVALLEDGLDNLYLDAVSVQPLDGPVVLPAGMFLGGRSILFWAFLGMVVAVSGLVLYQIVRAFRKRGQSAGAGGAGASRADIPLFPGPRPAVAAQSMAPVPPRTLDEVPTAVVDAPRPPHAWARTPAPLVDSIATSFSGDNAPTHSAAAADVALDDERTRWDSAAECTPVPDSVPAWDSAADCAADAGGDFSSGFGSDSASDLSSDSSSDSCSDSGSGSGSDW